MSINMLKFLRRETHQMSRLTEQHHDFEAPRFLLVYQVKEKKQYANWHTYTYDTGQFFETEKELHDFVASNISLVRNAKVYTLGNGDKMTVEQLLSFGGKEYIHVFS